MAITYTKPLKSIQISTLGGTGFQVTDTVSSPDASMALAQFLKGETMNFPYQGAILYVPFHAVEAVGVQTQTSEPVEKADPYCDEEEGD